MLSVDNSSDVSFIRYEILFNVQSKADMSGGVFVRIPDTAYVSHLVLIPREAYRHSG